MSIPPNIFSHGPYHYFASANIIMLGMINSSTASDTYMPQWHRRSLVQIMTIRAIIWANTDIFFNRRSRRTLKELWFNISTFHSVKYFWKCFWWAFNVKVDEFFSMLWYADLLIFVKVKAVTRLYPMLIRSLYGIGSKLIRYAMGKQKVKLGGCLLYSFEMQSSQTQNIVVISLHNLKVKLLYPAF